ncbi:hypothetical protein SAMN05216502_101120 [Citrobacter amalonaticus]|nr:hypothetical protein EAS1808013_037130 [Enterobacter asburiae]SFA69277.1 hypothetical protein SAMN05216502_101120 [Citrobacter amalonaticus]
MNIEQPFICGCRDNNKPFLIIPQTKWPRVNGSHENRLTAPAVNEIRLFFVPLAYPFVPPVSKNDGAAGAVLVTNITR